MWEIASSQMPTTMASSSGRVLVDAQPKARLDALGIFWIVFALSWTFLLAAGMFYLYRRRDMPMLKIRGLNVSFVAIAFLHLYWGAVQTGYCYGPLAPPVVEFWIMSVWLPFGIALFHASNSRFLHVAQKQKELFARGDASAMEKRPRRAAAKSGTLLGRFRDWDYSKKILVLVGIGMGVQVRYLLSACSLRANRLVLPDRLHVSCFPQVPQVVWHPRHRSHGHRRAEEAQPGPRLGVVGSIHIPCTQYG